METLQLAGKWKLRAEFMDVTSARFTEVLERADGPFEMWKEDKPRHMPSRTGWMQANVPCDIITPLVENGILPEPLLQTNSTECMWVGDYSWWFKRRFTVTEALFAQEEIRLFIEMLDYDADIILNGRHIGKHKNTFRPFEADVKAALRLGENELLIRLTTGYEAHGPNDSLTFYCNSKLGQRVYLRKPQFTHGWDWCKPVPTCGIGGRIVLTGISGACISSFRADTLSVTEKSAAVKLVFEAENLSMCTADDAILHVTLRKNGETVCAFDKDFYAAGGLNYIEETLTIETPALWWPNGYGAQPLYDVSASVTCRGVTNAMPDRKIGIRTITFDQSKYADGTRHFDFVVNGQRIFCKGGNWVPADSVYLRVPAAKYETLVREAAACGFNMLRIWGGGLYEPDCFYDFCSENGILLMHDFMYACAFYPDDLPWFTREAALEAEYQTKRLSGQTCMAVWTGNNEVHESYTDWFKGNLAAERYAGVKIFNYILPEVVKRNAPQTPYMPSSPFFGSKANDLLSGDSHVWSWMRPEQETGFAFQNELEAFDRLAAKVRFSSEYGFYGPLQKSSVAKQYDGADVVMHDAIWKHHGEQDNKRMLIDSILTRHLIDAATLDVDGYLLYGGIMQGILYDEMTTALRRRAHCSGQLIWMYNDCWPETGWTVIDSYCTRKSSFYFLKRAFAPRKLIMRNVDGAVCLTCLNDSPDAVSLRLEHGYMDFEGGGFDQSVQTIELPAFGWREITLGAARRDLQAGFYYAKPLNGEGFAAAVSLRGYYRDYAFPQADIQIVRKAVSAGKTVLVVKTDVFAPVVHIQTADDSVHMSDNDFMLLPNEEKEITIEAEDEGAAAFAVAFTKRECDAE